MTRTIDVQQTKTSLDDLLKLLDADTDILLTRGDVPFARLSPVEQVAPQPRVAGLHRGTTWVSDDFDAPLPDDFWLGNE